MRMLQIEIFIDFLSSFSPLSSSLLHCLPSTLPLLSLSLSFFLSGVWLGERFIQGLSWTIHRLFKWFLMMAKSFILLFKQLLWWRNVCVCLVTQLCLTLCKSMDCSPPGSSVHEVSPGKNTGVGCHALFQGIFPTQILNPCLLVSCVSCIGGRVLYYLGSSGLEEYSLKHPTSALNGSSWFLSSGCSHSSCRKS